MLKIFIDSIAKEIISESEEKGQTTEKNGDDEEEYIIGQGDNEEMENVEYEEIEEEGNENEQNKQDNNNNNNDGENGENNNGNGLEMLGEQIDNMGL